MRNILGSCWIMIWFASMLFFFVVVNSFFHKWILEMVIKNNRGRKGRDKFSNFSHLEG